MFTEGKTISSLVGDIIKKNSGAMVIGYDLGDTSSQISYCPLDSGVPETVSAVMGTEQYNIPTLLCKKKDVNQWFYGKEAIQHAEQEAGFLVDKLFKRACSGEMVMVGEEEFDPVALLTLFVKRSMALLSSVGKTSQMAAVMFSVEELGAREVEVLSQVAAGLKLKPEMVYFQSHRESFYHYTIRQPRELWAQQVLICELNTYLKIYLLGWNKRTTPNVFYVQKEEFRDFLRGAPDDGQFLGILQEVGKNKIISTAYLLGDGFKEKWADESLRFLCRGRRVFQGNNLFSKGACHGALEKLRLNDNAGKFVFLGEDKLKANIGIRVLRRGRDSYYALLDAGINWYEAKGECELILESGRELNLIISLLIGGAMKEHCIMLEGLMERPERTTRLRLELKMLSAGQLQVTVTDLGFGEFFPAYGKQWIQLIEL